jgi:hypothetical protein|tara:strand:+ start:169 stop:330 length:162 start_codon:yes stop_codon:yes gene_type:complete
MRVNTRKPRRNIACFDGWEHFQNNSWVCGKSVSNKINNRIRGIKNKKTSLIKR